MSFNQENIKKDLTLLFKRHLQSNKDDLNADVDNSMRKLIGFVSFEVPSMVKIEEEILNQIKRNKSNDGILIEVHNYIRKIKNMSIRDPARLLFFLRELSPMCKDQHATSSVHMKPFLAATRSMYNIKTSTPLTRSSITMNKPIIFDINSERSSNRMTAQLPNSLTKSSSVQNVSTGNRNNSFMPSNQIKSSHNYQVSNELTDHAIVGDLLYVILGCNGQYFSWNTSLVRLELLNGVVVKPYMHVLISKLSKVGMAYSKIRAYVERCCHNKSAGVVCQGICSALNEHLASYTNLVSVLHSQYNTWTAELEKSGYLEESENRLTTQRLDLWLHSPAETLFFIMTIVDNLANSKGGDLASTVHKYLLNGASLNHKLSRHLLLSAVEPIFEFIRQWIYDGVLEESHQEFFVAVKSNYDLDCTWTEKYAIRDSMVPSFISTSEAEKILLAGKSINFLREICAEKANFKNKREFFKLRNVTAESMINQDVDRSFENMIRTVSEETSKNLLVVMFEKYHLMGHLKALRNYMLQGQGDFILRLIEILGPELSKPGGDLYAHNMMGPLDEALKTTNAQYDPREILDRIDIKFMKVSDNETGWDMFALNYQINDVRPLLAVVSKDAYNCYLRTFIFLFRSRRVHFILNSFFKRQNSSRRAFNAMPDVSRVIHFSQIIILEMLHFVNQIQYYINFEVLESSWKKFTEDVGKASDLTEVMTYHLAFLKQITQRCLLEPESRDLLSNLRSIYDLIISFESMIHDMFSTFQNEVQLRRTFQEELHRSEKEGRWGENDPREKKEKQRRLVFSEKDVLNFQHKLKSHHHQYQTKVVSFLSSLMDHGDPTLRCLCTHIDFNYRYKDLIRDFRRRH